jgi:thioredoxin reductase
MVTSTDIAIIGAGPYGLSIAAQLRRKGLNYQIIGDPMHNWKQMPKGMLLKSDGFASNLYGPDGEFTLEQYCRERKVPYGALAVPVDLETFISYGLDFQKRMVPDVRNTFVTRLDSTPSGFILQLEDGALISCRAVVVAIGLSSAEFIPDALAGLPKEFLSHSSNCNHIDRSNDREITVIGGGSSAIDVVALLHESKTTVRLVSRRSALEFHSKMTLPRPLWDQLRRPLTGIGPGWRSRFFCDAPLLFHFLPEKKRLEIVRTYLGPAGGWFMKERMAEVPQLLGYELRNARMVDGRVELQFTSSDGETRRLMTDYVIAATGYKVNLRRMTFLNDEIRSHLQSDGDAPSLSAHFESSVPGLFFAGPAAANSFGPVMRFVFGAAFTARRIFRRLSQMFL